MSVLITATDVVVTSAWLAGPLFLCLLRHHRDDAFWVESLSTLVEMTSLGEGGCDLA